MGTPKTDALKKIGDELTRSRRIRSGWLRDEALLRSWLGIKTKEALVLALDFARPPVGEHAGLFPASLDADVFDLISEPEWLFAILEERGLNKRLFTVADPLAVPDQVLAALGWRRDEVLVECALSASGRRHGSHPQRTGKNVSRRFAWFVRERLLPPTAAKSDETEPPPLENPPEVVAAWHTLNEAVARIGWSPPRLRDRPCARCHSANVESVDLSVRYCWRCRKALGAAEPSPENRNQDCDAYWSARSFQPAMPSLTSVAAIDQWLMVARLTLRYAWVPSPGLQWAREPDAWMDAFGWLFYEGHYSVDDAEWMLLVATLGAADALVREHGFEWEFPSDGTIHLIYPGLAHSFPVAKLLKTHGENLPESFPEPAHENDDGDGKESDTSQSILERARNAIRRVSRKTWPELTATSFMDALNKASESISRVLRDHLERTTRLYGTKAEWNGREYDVLGQYLQELAERMTRETDGNATRALNASFPVDGREVWTYGSPATGGFRLDLTTFDFSIWKPQGNHSIIYAAELQWEPNGGWRVIWDMEKNGISAENFEPFTETHPPRIVVAAANGDLEELRRLLDTFPGLLEANDGSGDVNDGAPTTPLLAAAEAGRLEAVRFLVERGATLYRGKRPGYCPALLRAAKGGHVAVVKYLLDSGVPVEPALYASPDKGDGNGNPGEFMDGLISRADEIRKNIDLAKTEGNEDALLLARNEALGVWDDLREELCEPCDTTPLYEAVLAGQNEMARLLIARGANPNFSGAMGTVLNIATFQPGMTDDLLKAGANNSQRDPSGKTPLLAAIATAAMWEAPAAKDDADEEFKQMAEQAKDSALRLLRIDADVNVADHQGQTALHIAADSGSVFWVKTLLERGADPKIKNNDGQTPADIAESRGDISVLKYLG